MAATSKEYSMMFKLSAQFGAGFGTTFSNAQNQLKETQREIQALNKQQANIAAYQRQQQSIEATTKKLALLQQQHNNIQKEIQETEGYSSFSVLYGRIDRNRYRRQASYIQ